MMLAQQGLVACERRGASAYCRIADPSVYDLCDIVCDNIASRIARASREGKVFARSVKASGAGKPGKRTR